MNTHVAGQVIESVTPVKKSRNENLESYKNYTSSPTKEIKKFYPADYFKRSGYNHQPYGQSSDVMVDHGNKYINNKG